MKKCKWCGRYFDPYDNYLHNSSFCSLKCEDEYYGEGSDAEDELPKNTVNIQKTKAIYRTKTKVLYRNDFAVWAALNYAFYVFGIDGRIESGEKVAIRNSIKEVFNVDIFDFDSFSYTDDVTESWKDDWINKKNITKLTETIDFLLDNAGYLYCATKFQIMEVIVKTNNALNRKSSDRADAKARFDVYEMLDISIDDYNRYVK
ncbi:MAG TPA: hypothetical protein PLQ82_08320 [Desulfobacteraceae bacterium]|nr:hypothetical protein [Desulfobacteraceae bacterium]